MSAGAHDGRPRRWRAWRNVEGGMLIDLEGLEEAVRALGAEETHLVDADDPERREAARRLAALLDAGVDRCPHGLPLWVDLSRPLDGLLAGPVMGSGRSPWTRMLLELLERRVRPGDRVADVGTGTGILALRAARLGAREVDALDHDPLALAVARWNVRASGSSERIRVRAGSAADLAGRYDLVMVSLWAYAELPPVLAAAVGYVAPAGWLLATPAEGAAESEALRDDLAGLGADPVERLECEGWFAWAARVP